MSQFGYLYIVRFMQELVITIFIVIWIAVVAAFVMYMHVVVTMKDKYYSLWNNLFSGGVSNTKFWKWLSQGDFSEIDDTSFKKQLFITTRLWWFATVTIGVSILCGVIFVVWRIT